MINPLKLIYSSLYYDFKKRDNEEKARANGTLISTILIFLLFFAALLLCVVYFPNFEQKSTNFLTTIFDDKTVIKGISRLFLVAFFGVIYFTIKYTIGTKTSYNKIVQEFLLLTPEQQKGIKRKANPYFLTPIILFITSLIILMTK